MFQFTDEQKMIKEMVERLGRDEIGPLVEAADTTGYSSPEIVRHLAENGLLKMSLPTEYGGIDADYTTIAAVVEELAKVDASAAMIVFVNQTVIQILRDWGNEAQKTEFFGRMSSGDKINAFSLTEPGFGSESSSIQTRAVREREHADGSQLCGKIAAVLRHGYQYVIDEENLRVVRCAQVKLYG